jgi:Mg-chelatase subunit ChlD
MSNELFKPPNATPGGIQLNKGKLQSATSPFQQRVNAAKSVETDATSKPHRICLMLDKSSSMCAHEDTKSATPTSRIQLLKDAVQNFVQRCDFRNTALAIETFPAALSVPLTSNGVMLSTAMFAIEAAGGTPMQECVQRVLTAVPLTRGVIVSDGEATDWHESDAYDDFEKVVAPGNKLLATYKEQGIPIDCVHIGGSSSGEALLRRIAEQTGGLYLKFTDVSAFANSFGFLTPGYRAQLTDGTVSAAQLGARELKR